MKLFGALFGWKCHESAMERDMNMIYLSMTILKQIRTFMANTDVAEEKIKIMSDSWHFHGSFMVVSWHFHIQAWPGYSLPKSIEKKGPKSWFQLSIVFFCLISVSFFATCQIHAGFMALPWHFLHPDFCVFSWKQNPNQQLKPSQKWPSSLKVRFIAHSSRIHGAFYHFKIVMLTDR